MENVILAGASFSPATKVAFRTDLTERRFKETERLLLFQGETGSLAEFVGDVQIVQEELFQLSSFEDKKELSDKLIAKIDEYEVKLAQVQTRVEQAPAAAEPAQTPFQQIPTQQTPTSAQQTPLPGQTPRPEADQPGTPAPPAIQIPIFQPQPQPQTVVSLPPSEKEKVKERIEQAKEKLKEIKKEVKKDKEDAEVKEKIKEEQEKLRENLKEGKVEEERSGRNERNND